MIMPFITTLIFSVACLPAFADEKVDKTWVKNKAFNAAKKYAESIACETSIDKKNLIALRPWKIDDIEDRSYAKYALIWHGDIGCNGGSGTTTWNISIIQIGVGSNFVINPAISSPMVRVPLPYKSGIQIMKATESTITVRTRVEESSDNGCCDSIIVDLKLKADKHGNWDLVNRKNL